MAASGSDKKEAYGGMHSNARVRNLRISLRLMVSEAHGCALRSCWCHAAVPGASERKSRSRSGGIDQEHSKASVGLPVWGCTGTSEHPSGMVVAILRSMC